MENLHDNTEIVKNTDAKQELKSSYEPINLNLQEENDADKKLDIDLNGIDLQVDPDIFKWLDEHEVKKFKQQKEQIKKLWNSLYNKTFGVDYWPDNIHISNFANSTSFHIDYNVQVGDISYFYMVDVSKNTDQITGTVSHVPDKNKPREKTTVPFGSTPRSHMLSLMTAMDAIIDGHTK